VRSESTASLQLPFSPFFFILAQNFLPSSPPLTGRRVPAAPRRAAI
jgi:hypothetical protein